MSEQTLIEVATPADAMAAISLLARQLREHGIVLGNETLQAAIDVVVADPCLGFVLIAKDDLEPIGVAYVAFIWSLEHGGKTAWLEELYVHPGRREQGVGTVLLGAVLQQARSCGCAAIDLEIDQEHARAAHLYLREGFKPLMRNRWVKVL